MPEPSRPAGAGPPTVAAPDDSAPHIRRNAAVAAHIAGARRNAAAALLGTADGESLSPSSGSADLPGRWSAALAAYRRAADGPSPGPLLTDVRV